MMQITSLALGDFKRLQVSKIKEIYMDVSQSNAQLILGSNGSGKSSILRELFPTAPTKSGFTNNGFKELDLIHESIKYKLRYDPMEGHQFFRDDVQLNTGMTNDIQKELIFKYLGVSADIQSILTCSLNMCDMTPSQRKKVMMTLNPVDVSLFLEKHQIVKKNTLALSNNLDRLYQRQKQLLEQKLPEEQYQKMIAHRHILEDKEKLLLIWATKASSEKSKYLDTTGVVPPALLTQQLKDCIRMFDDFSSIDRVSYSLKGTEYSTKVQMLEEGIREIESKLEETVVRLNEYEEKKRSLSNADPGLLTELNDLKSKVNGHDVRQAFVPILPNDLTHASDVLEAVTKLLVNLSYLEYSEILNKDALRQLERQVSDKQQVISTTGNELKIVNRQIEELARTVKSYKLGNPCDSKCELLITYKNHATSKQAEIEVLNVSKAKLTSTLDGATVEYTQIKELYDTQSSVWDTLEKVFRVISTNRSLTIQYSTEYILDRVRSAPLQLINDISTYINDSEKQHAYDKIILRIRELESISDSVKSKQQLSADVINVELTKYSQQLDELRAQHLAKNTAIAEIRSHQSLLTKFTSTISQLESLSASSSTSLIKAENHASYTYLTKLEDLITDLRHQISSELTEISRLIRDQETLLARLDQEVDSIISELKPKYEKSKLVEKSLYELPIKYTKSFVNSTIDTANYFISELLTYELLVTGYDEVTNCDFSLPVLINSEVASKDINTCSDGQKAIINLAFNLALIIELKYNEYPIYVDEIDRALDPTHAHRLTKLLNSLISKGIVSQMFVVNHHETMINGIVADITILNGDNITLPNVYNEHVTIVNT